MKLYIYILSLGVSLIIGFFLGVQYMQTKLPKTQTSSAVLLEKIKEVFKVGLIEADFSELINHKEYNWFDLSPFRKTAIIRVQAKVTAGVVLDTANIKIDEKSKMIILQFDRDPKILSIDHKMDYYDLQQGTFNYFSSSEITQLEDKAKEMIRSKAIQGGILEKAKTRSEDMITMLKQMVEPLGWHVEIIKPIIIPFSKG